MGHRGRIVVTLFALTAVTGLVSACTSSESGTPAPASGGNPAATSAPPGSTEPSLPTPPTASTEAPIANPLDLSNVKPCSLFTPQLDKAASLDAASTPVDSEISTLPGSKACFMANPASNRGLAIALTTKQGLAEFVKKYPSGVERFDVQGYPAVTVELPGGVPACFGAIGVADQQMVYLRYTKADPTSAKGQPLAQLCSGLHPIAEQVVAQIAH